jgi:hypothetical protein
MASSCDSYSYANPVSAFFYFSLQFQISWSEQQQIWFQFKHFRRHNYRVVCPFFRCFCRTRSGNGLAPIRYAEVSDARWHPDNFDAQNQGFTIDMQELHPQTQQTCLRLYES